MEEAPDTGAHAAPDPEEAKPGAKGAPRGDEYAKPARSSGRRGLVIGAVVAAVVVFGLALGVGLGVGLRKKSSSSNNSGPPLTLVGSTTLGVGLAYPYAPACTVVSAYGYVNTPNLTLPGAVPLAGALGCDPSPAIVFSGTGSLPFLVIGGVNFSSISLAFATGPVDAASGSKFVNLTVTGASLASGGASASVLALNLLTVVSANATVPPVTTVTSATSTYAVSGNAGVLTGAATGMALLLPPPACSGAATSASVSGLYYVNLPGLVMAPLNVAGAGACNSAAAGTLFAGGGSAASATYNGTALSTVSVSIAVSQGASRRALLGLQQTVMNITATAINNQSSAQGFSLSATQSGSDAPALSATFAPPQLVFGELDTFALGLDNITGPLICSTTAAPRAVTGSVWLKLPALGLTMSPSPTPMSGNQFCNGSNAQGLAFSMTGSPTTVTMGPLTSTNNALTYITGTVPEGDNNGSLFSTVTLLGTLSRTNTLATNIQPTMSLYVIANSVKPNRTATPTRVVNASVIMGVAVADGEFQMNATIDITYPCNNTQNGMASMLVPALGNFVINGNITSSDCALSSFTLYAYLPAQAKLAGFGVADALFTAVYDASQNVTFNFSVTMPLIGNGLLNATWQKPFSALSMTATYPNATVSVFSNAMYSLLYPTACTVCPTDMPSLANSPLAGSTVAAGLVSPTYTNLVAMMKFTTPTPGKLSGTTLAYIGAAGSVSYLGATTTGGIVLKRDNTSTLQSLITIDMPCSAAGFALYPTVMNAVLTGINRVAQFNSSQVVRSTAPTGFFGFFSPDYASVPQGVSWVFYSTQTLTALAGTSLSALIGSINTASVTAPSGNTAFIGTWLGTAAASTLKVSMATTACSYALVSGVATKGYSFFISYTAGASSPSVGITLTPLAIYNGTVNEIDVSADLQYNAPSAGTPAGSFSANTQYTGATPWTNPFGISSNLQIAYPIGVTMSAAAAPFAFGSLGMAGTINSLADTRYSTPMSGTFSIVSPPAGSPPVPAMAFTLTNIGVGRMLYALTKDLLTSPNTPSLTAPLTAIYPWMDGMSVASANVSYNPTSAPITDALANVIPVGLQLNVARLSFFDLFTLGSATFTLPTLTAPASWPEGVQIAAALDKAISIGSVLTISGSSTGTTPPSLLLCAVPPTVAQVVGRRSLLAASGCTPGNPLMAVNGYISVLGQSMGISMAASTTGFAIEGDITALGASFSLDMALSVPGLWTGGFASGGSLLSTLASSSLEFSVTPPELGVLSSSVSSAVVTALTQQFNSWAPFQTLQTALDQLPSISPLSGAVTQSAVVAAATDGLKSATSNFGQSATAAFTSAFGNGYTYDPNSADCPLGNGKCCLKLPTIAKGAFASATWVSPEIPSSPIGGQTYCPGTVTISASTILGAINAVAGRRHLLDDNTTAAITASALRHHAGERKLMSAIDVSSCVTSTTYNAVIGSPAIPLSLATFGAQEPQVTVAGITYYCHNVPGLSMALCNPTIDIPAFSKTLSISIPTGVDETCITNKLGATISTVTNFATTYATGPFTGLANGLTSFLNASSSGFSNVFSITSFAVAPIALTGASTTLSATFSFTLLGKTYTNQQVAIPLGAGVTALANVITGVAADAFSAATNLVGAGR